MTVEERFKKQQISWMLQFIADEVSEITIPKGATADEMERFSLGVVKNLAALDDEIFEPHRLEEFTAESQVDAA